MDENGIPSTLPKSDISNPFGNIKAPCSVLYNPHEELYYFFQWNRWNYEKGSVLGGIIQGDMPAAQDMLARINTVDTSLENRKVISDFAVNGLRYDSGNIFYTVNGVINLLNTEASKEIFDLYRNGERIDRFVISDNILYYTIREQAGLWSMPINMLPPEPKKIAQEIISDFQVIGETVFYSSKEGIFELTENDINLILEKSNVSNFLIDGVLLYKDNAENLFTPSEQKPIAEDVSLYTVLDDLVIYSTNNGLFKRDLNKASVEHIINFDEDSWLNRNLVSLAVYNDKVFLDVTTKWHSSEGVTSIYVYELNSNSLNPLVSIENDKMQKYHCKEMGYELYYPIGYVIQFDPGSYLSGQTLFTDPSTGIFIRVMNYGYFYGLDDSSLNGTKIITNEGVVGYYNISESEKDFMLSYTTTNGYRFIAEGTIDNVDDAKMAFTKMIKSLKVFE